ncbi:hypothetical protein CEXT_305781 [Caerostris extrusa]|uniref:THAP-type domain-containing protein n=1 Tax=Caerostris extrusa TaxID=172846 RepID=A0AAV4XQD5_CAEEX|nr:hypothetical protein CEXT_305781 [Caerostris extrusa]
MIWWKPRKTVALQSFINPASCSQLLCSEHFESLFVSLDLGLECGITCCPKTEIWHPLFIHDPRGLFFSWQRHLSFLRRRLQSLLIYLACAVNNCAGGVVCNVNRNDIRQHPSRNVGIQLIYMKLRPRMKGSVDHASHFQDNLSPQREKV